MADRVPQDPLAAVLPGMVPIPLGRAALEPHSLPELGGTLDRCLEEVDLWRARQTKAADSMGEAPLADPVHLWGEHARDVRDEIVRRVADLRECEEG